VARAELRGGERPRRDVWDNKGSARADPSGGSATGVRITYRLPRISRRKRVARADLQDADDTYAQLVEESLATLAARRLLAQTVCMR
jgi:hypothetical protein